MSTSKTIFSRCNVVLYVLCSTLVWPLSGKSATIDTAHDVTGKNLFGITVEGDIEPGDARKLRTAVLAFDVTYAPQVARYVFLRSRGGDVEESMKMGAYIRRLRLETEVPTKVEGHNDIFNAVSISDKHNEICASACFLVYAGGVARQGNFLALHRPYLPMEVAKKTPDAEYEATEKKTMKEVAAYLVDMDVDQFFIDKMMATSSQDAYFVGLWETDRYNLSKLVPSIEEVLLSKCSALTSQEKKDFDTKQLEKEERDRIIKKLLARISHTV